VYTWIIEGFTTPQTPCNSPTFVTDKFYTRRVCLLDTNGTVSDFELAIFIWLFYLASLSPLTCFA
jgi:hypothetical protein